MFLISHRGNTSGPDPKNENKIEKIEQVIKMGFDVEIDVRVSNNKIFLGHDNCVEEINESWLKEKQKNLWIHCKNLNAIDFFLKTNYNWFWHQEDDYAITSKGFIWTYPCKINSKNSIAVLPEICNDYKIDLCCGVCSDFPFKYKNLFK